MNKGLVAWWAKNPVAGNLLMVACLILGVVSFFRMEKEYFPPGRDDGIQILASWPGASPADVESQVTLRIEEATADLDGLNWVRSRSFEGGAWVNLSFDPGQDPDERLQEVRAKIDQISDLPAELRQIRVTRQQFRSFSVILGVHGNVDERLLRDTAERIREEIKLLPGAINTSQAGAREPEVSIEVSEQALQRFGLTFDDVAQAIRRQSFTASGGTVRTDDGSFQIQARAQADSAPDFERIVVRQTAEGGEVTVGDVATVIDGFQDVDLFTRMNGDRAVMLFVETADKFNIWQTTDAVENYLQKLQLPEGIQVSKVYLEADDYNDLLEVLWQNALQGFVLIFLLLLLTLHPQVAFWSTMGVVTAFAGSFIILPYIGVSLNFLTVFAFLLVLGIMVDDAIIVGEAIYEKVERGGHGVDSAILATQLVMKPLIASVLTTMIAFSPLMFISGETQQFTRSISIVVMSTLFFSLVETLIILPAHLSHVRLPKRSDSFGGRLMALQQRSAHSVVWFGENVFGPLVRLSVRWRYVTLAVFVSALVLAVTVMSTGRVKTGFMPEVEGDFMIVSIELPATTPFPRLEQVAGQLNQARLQLEANTQEFATVDSYTGNQTRGVIRNWTTAIEGTTVRAYVGLTRPETRKKLRSSKVTEDLRTLMGPVPDADRISFELSGNDNGAAISIALLGENKQELRAAADALKAELSSLQEVISVRDSEEAAIEELQITLKPGAEQLGLTLADITSQARQAFYGLEVQQIPREGDFVRVFVRYPREDRRSLDSLSAFRLRTPDGREIPLAAVADVTYAPGVTGLDRRQRQPTITVEAEASDTDRQKIMAALEDGYFANLSTNFPSVSRRAIGQLEEQQRFFNEISTYMGIALLAIYGLLAVVFRSYWLPIIILTPIAFTLTGSILGHLVFDSKFVLFSWLGMIAAAGVVVNDGVVLLDRTNQLRGFFGLRRAGQGSAMPEGANLTTVVAADGSTWEVCPLNEDVDIREEWARTAVSQGFVASPLEAVDASTVKREKSELQEQAIALEQAGFRLARARAEDGVMQGSITRFRQIFLTSITEFVGLAPMLFEDQVIAQFLKPMALSLAFGVLLCMPVTLILTPVLYLIGRDIREATFAGLRLTGLMAPRPRYHPAE